MTALANAPAKSAKKKAPAQALYLYAISQSPERQVAAIAAEAIDGSAAIEGVRCREYLCWVSRVPKAEFADKIADRMQDLEWLAESGLRHQRVVSEIASQLPILPARFATVFLSEASLANHVDERKNALQAAFARVADADEWGIKIFALGASRARPVKPPSSGSEYLQRKAEMLQPRGSKKLDASVAEFVSAVKAIAVAECPGGKASAGQPGLVWHGSFLIRRKNRKKLDAALKKYAAAWRDVRRIDCSGPWPPYSFVGEHV
jgi:Gas vesicle synthesis protein GvpL/GvpF